MTNRRDFISKLGLLCSANIFTPHIIRPTWKDTLRYNGYDFNEYMNVNEACEHFRHIIHEILIPSIRKVQSDFIKKRALELQ